MQSATKPAGTHRTDQQLLNTVAQTGDTETSVPSSNLVKFINIFYEVIGRDRGFSVSCLRNLVKELLIRSVCAGWFCGCLHQCSRNAAVKSL